MRWNPCTDGQNPVFIKSENNPFSPLSSFLKNESFLYSLLDSHQFWPWLTTPVWGLQLALTPCLLETRHILWMLVSLVSAFSLPLADSQLISSDLCDGRARQWARSVVCDPHVWSGWGRVDFLEGSCFLNAFLFFFFQSKTAYERERYVQKPRQNLQVSAYLGSWQGSEKVMAL